jgi:hypothetical protein
LTMLASPIWTIMRLQVVNTRPAIGDTRSLLHLIAELKLTNLISRINFVHKARLRITRSAHDRAVSGAKSCALYAGKYGTW